VLVTPLSLMIAKGLQVGDQLNPISSKVRIVQNILFRLGALTTLLREI
jgi:hypothetical protein